MKNFKIMAPFLKNFSIIKKYEHLKPFSIDFKEGLSIIVGENGSGKSTLLRLMQMSDKDLSLNHMSREVSPCEFHFLIQKK